jgi:WD40 repeat protein
LCRRKCFASSLLAVCIIVAPLVSWAAATPISAENANTLARIAALPIPESFVNTLAFSADGRTLVSGDRNGEVAFWEVESSTRRIFLPALSTLAADEAARVAFWGTLAVTPDEGMIIRAYGDDGEVIGFDAEGNELFSFSCGARVYALAVSPDGKYLAASGIRNTISILDLGLRQSVTELVTDHEYILNLAFSPNGRTLLGACERPSNVLKEWDVGTWHETASFAHTAVRFDYHDVLFTPDGREIVIGTTQDVEIMFFDAVTKETTRSLANLTRAPYQLAFSPDGALLAAAGDDGTVRIWSLATGAVTKTILVGDEVGTIAFSRDGTLLAFSIWGTGIEVWAVTP